MEKVLQLAIPQVISIENVIGWLNVWGVCRNSFNYVLSINMQSVYADSYIFPIKYLTAFIFTKKKSHICGKVFDWQFGLERKQVFFFSCGLKGLLVLLSGRDENFALMERKHMESTYPIRWKRRILAWLP